MQPWTQSLDAYGEILVFINLQLKNNVLFIRTLFCEGPRDGNYAYTIPFRNWGPNRDLVLQFSFKMLLNIT